MKRAAALEARAALAEAPDSGRARRAATRMVVRTVALAALLGTAYIVFRIATG